MSFLSAPVIKFPSAAILLLVLMLALLSCGDHQAGLEPLPSEYTGGFVAGTLRAGDTVVDGATVRLEPVYGGIALSVLRKIDGTGDIPVSSIEYASEIRVTVSDSEGRYVFDGLEEGTYLIGTHAEDHIAGSAQVNITPALAAAADTTFVDIDLVPT